MWTHYVRRSFQVFYKNHETECVITHKWYILEIHAHIALLFKGVNDNYFANTPVFGTLIEEYLQSHIQRNIGPYHAGIGLLEDGNVC